MYKNILETLCVVCTRSYKFVHQNSSVLYWFYKALRFNTMRNVINTSSPCASTLPCYHRNHLPHVSSTATSSRTSCCSSNTNTSSRRNVFANAPWDLTCPRTPYCSTCTRTVSPQCAFWCAPAAAMAGRRLFRTWYTCRVTCVFGCAFLGRRGRRRLFHSTYSWIVFGGFHQRHSGIVCVLTGRRRWSSFCHSRGIGVAHPVVVFRLDLLHYLVVVTWWRSLGWGRIGPLRGKPVGGVGRGVVGCVCAWRGAAIRNCHCCKAMLDPSPCNRGDGGKRRTCRGVGRRVLWCFCARFVGRILDWWGRCSRRVLVRVLRWSDGRHGMVVMVAAAVMAGW